MFAAAIWHNVYQPLNVSGEIGGSVDPLDVLTIINEINSPVLSDPITRALPQQLPDNHPAHPFFDIDCDSAVTALDALTVINAINSGVYDPDWVLASSSPLSATGGRIAIAACSPKIIEGDSYYTDMTRTIVIPDDTSAVRVSIETPIFDLQSAKSIRDAFEILLLDQQGTPLVLPYGTKREASFNWSERTDPIVGPGTQSTVQPNGSISTATFNLAGLAGGTVVQVRARLVNNDSDTNSSVVIRRVEIINSTTPAPTGMSSLTTERNTKLPIDSSLLVDVTSSVQLSYGRTTLTENKKTLVTELQIENQNRSAISGRTLLVLENFTETEVGLIQPDGYLELGNPYVILSSENGSDWLGTGDRTASRELRFYNPSEKQFQFQFRVLAQLNSAPTSFVSTPLLEIQAGKTYRSVVKANDPDNQALVYTKVVGPEGLVIDSATGVMHWNTTSTDVGNQSVVIRASDPYGLSVDQSFTIAVLEVLPNRPPVFTSTPSTDAMVARPFEVLTYATGASPVNATVSDFGTGNLSIVTANMGEQQLGLLRGTGNETFGLTQHLSIGEIPPSKFSTPFITGASVDLGFLPNTYSNNERNVLSLVNADVNGDGFLDFGVAIDTNGADFGPDDVGFVGVRLGNGDGTFRQSWETQLPNATLGGSGVSSRADSIRFGDVNGDKRLDLVVVQSLGSKALVYVGNADGTFENTPMESTVNQPFTYSFSSQLGDINNDGKLDLVSYEYQRDGRFRTGTHVRLGDGTGRFSDGAFYANTNNNSGDGYLADANSDGWLDTIRINYSDARVETRLNDGSGTLGELKFSSTFFMVGNTRGGNNNPTSGYIADYNQDGKTDIVVATVDAFILLIGNGDGSFGDSTEFGNRLIAVTPASSTSFPLQIFPNAGRNDGKAPDINADGIPDFVFGNDRADQLSTAVNDGTGRFTIHVYQSGFSDDIGNGSVRGSNPTPHVSVGDFNLDGFGDVLLGRDQNFNSNVRVGGVGIALGGNEPGSLRLPEVTFSVDENIQVGNGNQVLADFDNDGLLDIASNIRSGVAIARGRADGSFETYTTGFNQFGVFPYSTLVTSDFDRDGNMDIAYLASLNNPGHAPSMTTLFGLGNGTFQRAAAPIPSLLSGTGASSGTISQQYGVAADVNGDGYPDLVYRIPNNHSNFATAKSLVVYLYDSSTRNLKLVTDRDNLLFTPHRGGFYQDEVVAFEDLNGDGKKELIAHSGAIGQNGITTTPERLTIWQPTNVASATDAADLFTRLEFNAPDISPGLGVEGSINAFLVADYNHDGKPDLAVGTQNGATRVLMGNGDFTFRSPVTYNTNQVTGVTSADVNGDGNLDLIPIWSGFFNFNDLPNAGVLLGKPDGSFGAYEGLTTSSYELNSPLSGDFNQDGRDDINYGNYFNSRLTVLAASPGLSSVATGDINGDGRLDIVALDTGFARLKILLGNGDDTFTRQKDLITGLQPESLLLQDIDGDGKLDILTSNRVQKSLSLFKNEGVGSFTRTDLPLANQPNRIAVGDLNGDGKPDIVATSEKSQSMSTLLSNASGFSAATEQPIGFAAADVVFADLTLDGKLDAILSDPAGKRIMILPGQGNGHFGVPIVQPLQLTPDRIAVTDLNSDGKPDVIASFPMQNQVGILFGRGAGRLTAPQLIGVGTTPTSVSVKDLNGDSKPDLLVTNAGDNTLSVIINRYDPLQVYRYSPTAIDPDTDPVTFELVNAPGGALYDDATQTIVWAPMPDQIGANTLVVRASDDRGGFSEQGFTVSVAAPASTVSPNFTSEPIKELSADQAYVYQPRISNPNNSPVRYSLVDAPEGATIDPITGFIHWEPRENGISLGVRGSFNFPNNVVNRGSISIPASASINVVSFTAEGWYKFDSLDSATLFRKYHSSFYNSWTLSNFFGTLRAEINNFGSTPDVRLDTIRLTTDQWYHIAFSYDDTTRLAQIYVNGELVGSVVSTGTPQLSNGELSVDGFEGTVANMRFWDRSRTVQEIQSDMRGDVSRTADGLVIDYHFGEGPDATSIVDSSLFGNHGNLVINGEFSRYNFPARVPSIAKIETAPFTIRVEDGKGGVATQSFAVKTLLPFARTIQGIIFDDANGNGIQDGLNEPGLVNQTVYVDRNGNHQLDTEETQSNTDTSGNYTLAYVGTEANVAILSKAGRVQSSPVLPSQFVDLSGGNASGVNFGTKQAVDGNPVFISVAPTTATVPGEFRYQSYAQSTDGSPLLYAIAVAPAGASIDAMSGLLTWTPKYSDAGISDVILKATDGAGRVALQAFRISVSINASPWITSIPPTVASQDVLFHYSVQAQDAEQSSLSYSFELAPTGASIDATSGKIRWTPSLTQLGDQSFLIVVIDGNGLEARQSFKVNVSLPEPNRAPVLTAGPRPSAQIGVKYNSAVQAVDADNDLLTYSMISGPVGASISSDGLIRWIPNELGPQAFHVQVVDNRGGAEDRSYTVDVGSSPVNGSIRFTSIANLDAVTNRPYAYDAIAPGAIQFQLLASPIGMSIDPVLGRIRWKPSAEQLGLATVRIQAIDALGNTAEQSLSLSVRRSDVLPTLASIPPTQAAVGSTYIYIVAAENPTGSPLVYSLSVAPEGMSINPQTGAVSWTPTAAQIGSQSVVLRVTDGIGNYLSQSFAIQVSANTPNRQPYATSIPPQDATVSISIAYRFVAVDPDGANLAYSVVAGPTGLSIDPVSGKLDWMPTTDQMGTVSITLKATDPLGAAAVQSFLIDVRGANRVPSISSVAPQSLPQGGLFRYDVIASDPDRELLFYELTTGPQGMTIDSFGRIRWQTALGTSLGQREVRVRVTDGRGGAVVQDFSVNVVADTTAPRISILTSSTVLSPFNLGPSVVKVQAVDDVAVTSLQLFVDGKPVAIRSDGTADVYFSAPGNGRLLAHAFDPAGNRGSATNNILMCSGEEECIPSGNTNQPQSNITNINDGDSVTGFVEVLGTASAVDFESYELSYRRSDHLTFTRIANSTRAVTGGLLGKWDTTLLENDSYVLRLETRDQFGGFSAIERQIGVSGNLKLGNFRLNFTDLTIPVAGIPITIARTYDTLRADRSGDFGYGWRMEFRNTDLRTSLPKTGLEDQGIYAAFKPNTKVYVTLPGGQREGFTFTPDIKVLPGFGGNLVIATPRFTSDRGVNNNLSAGSGNLLVNERGELYASGGIPWNPSSPDFSGYTLTTPDGIQYKIDGTGNLNAAIDRNGNALSFSDGGISSTSGMNVTFHRDIKDRIVSVTDPAGNSVKYAYDFKGDLSQVTDRMGNVTKFLYRTDRPHYLDSVIDPLGRTGLKSTYGADGRLTGTLDATGHGPTVNYDPDNSLVMTTDALGNKTISEYDARGNVVAQTNALGAVTRTTYDANNNITSTTDPLGHSVTFSRDDFGNELSRTDALGNVTRATYDAYGNVLNSISANGAVTSQNYDAKGNLSSASNALGGILEFGYTAGQLTSLTNSDGFKLHLNTVNGQTISLIDSTNVGVSYQYDSQNQVNKMISSDGKTSYSIGRDANNRAIVYSDPVGAISRVRYDAAGNRTATIDAMGNQTTFLYDDNNRLVRKMYADGTFELNRYDVVGRLSSSIDQEGRETRYLYDAIGQQIAILFPDNSPSDFSDNPRRLTQYDLAGRVISETNELGGTTRYNYDAANRKIAMIDALGAVTSTQLNSEGLAVQITDPLSRLTRFEYDLAGHVIAIVFPDGSRQEKTYSKRGDLLTDRDETGHVKHFEYNAFGQLTAVIDAMGNRTTYQYNSNKQLVATTDALQQTTQYLRDSKGQLVTEILPTGEFQTHTYDLVGNKLSTTDFAGRTTTYQYDVMNRLVTELHSDGVVIRRTYSPSGLLLTISSGNDVTRFEYDERGRQIARIDPNGQSVRSTYDVAGNRIAVQSSAGMIRYEYDAARRLNKITSPANEVTQYSYNSAGELIRTQFPNGTEQTLIRSLRGYVTQRESIGSIGVLERAIYFYDDAGREIRVAELDGRVVTHRYDASGRLIEEQITASSGSPQTTSYTYDKVGNRITQTDSNGITSYTYDSRGRSLLETLGNRIITSTYDANGNILSRGSGPTENAIYTWDTFGRMTNATIVNSTGTHVVNYIYAPDGERAARIDGNGTTRFVVDTAGEYATTIAELDQNGNVVTVYVRPPNGLGVVSQTRTNTTSYIHADGTYSVKLVTNAAGLVTDRIQYSAFGDVQARAGTTILTNLFHGEPRDSLTGLDYLRARQYSPSTGRFTSMDLFGGFLQNPLSQNRYVFANQNPVTQTDPSGRFTLTEEGLVLSINASIFAGVGATVGLKVSRYYGLNENVGVVAGFLLGGALGVFAPASALFLLFGEGASALAYSTTFYTFVGADLVALVLSGGALYVSLSLGELGGALGAFHTMIIQNGGAQPTAPFSSLPLTTVRIR